ncbi:MAG: HEAT repeat domain-containing protein [Terriglobales bacterium]
MNPELKPTEVPVVNGEPLNPRVTVTISGSKRTLMVTFFAFAIVSFFAFTGWGTTTARAAMQEIRQLLKLEGKPVPASANVLSEHELEVLDKLDSQAQAELLLERSINHYKGANEQIAARVARWRGDIELNDRLNGLFMTALNSDDLRVRAAALEVDIAARNLQKTSAQIDELEPAARNGEQGPRANALWNIALIGNRGVDPDRAAEILLSAIHDPNENIRYWSVEGLATLGSDASVGPLLEVFHDDSSAMIRERAACGLAQSGMLSEKQRRTAVPKLIDYADDETLDTQTHSWVFQALRDITGQSLPHTAEAWRNWYNSNDGNWNPVTHDQQ